MSEAEEQLPKDEQPAIRIFAIPTDINVSIDIHGLWANRVFILPILHA